MSFSLFSCVVLTVVDLLSFSGWHVADGFEHPSVVEPAHPFQGGVFEAVEVPPRSAAADQIDQESPESPRASR